MARWMPIAALAAALLGAPRVDATGGLRVVVVLDNSGSMRDWMPGGGTRIEAAKQALLTVLRQTPADAEVGLLLLNPARGEPWLVPLGPVDQDAVRSAVDRIEADGPTPLGNAMKTAADALLEAREAARYGDYKLLIVTDGEANRPKRVQRYLTDVQSRGLLVDVIGVAMQGEHSLARRANTYRAADEPASLEQAISEVVLGESGSGGSGDGGTGDGGTGDMTADADFDLIAPLPNELAMAAVTALASPANTPIGEPVAVLPGGPPVVPGAGDAGGGDGVGSGPLIRLLIVAALGVFILRAIASKAKAN
ncbi:MAG: vWA domain-containing protein [Planctomycetota bacterium]